MCSRAAGSAVGMQGCSQPGRVPAVTERCQLLLGTPLSCFSTEAISERLWAHRGHSSLCARHAALLLDKSSSHWTHGTFQPCRGLYKGALEGAPRTACGALGAAAAPPVTMGTPRALPEDEPGAVGARAGPGDAVMKPWGQRSQNRAGPGQAGPAAPRPPRVTSHPPAPPAGTTR